MRITQRLDASLMGNFLKRIKQIAIAAFGSLALLLAVEFGVRAIGAVDFPTYAVDDGIGYIVKPNQSGSFLHKRSWVFNDRSMGTARPWRPGHLPNILIIGNSIIMGGNPYEQKDKVGPMLQRAIGNQYSIWPIAVGGWSNINETVYMERNPDVGNSANFFVWEFMSGGLSDLSRWHSDYLFPRDKPEIATWYLFRRYVLPRILSYNMSELPPSAPSISADGDARFEAAIAKLSVATGRTTPGLIFLYPTKAQYLKAKQGGEWVPERAELERIAKSHGLKLVDIARSPEWNETLYREGTHPNVQGNAVLSHILSVEITNALRATPERTARRRTATVPLESDLLNEP